MNRTNVNLVFLQAGARKIEMPASRPLIRAGSLFALLSLSLVACGNKGDLFLDTNQTVKAEIKQLDDSLDDLDKGQQNETDAEPSLSDELEGETEKDKAIKKLKKLKQEANEAASAAE